MDIPAFRGIGDQAVLESVVDLGGDIWEVVVRAPLFTGTWNPTVWRQADPDDDDNGHSTVVEVSFPGIGPGGSDGKVLIRPRLAWTNPTP